jgi:hypothetical protein
MLVTWPASLLHRPQWLSSPTIQWCLLLALALLAQGCASLSGSGTDKYPPYQERAQTLEQGGLRVTVAVPTASEAESIYGVDLADEQMQPVWIEVQNDTTVPYWLLSSGLDPNYFASVEAAHAFHTRSADANQALDERFQRLQFRNPVMQKSTVSGFLLVNRDEGIKAVDVDLVTRGDAKNFTFMVPDPTFKGSSTQVGLDELYTYDELIHVDDEDQLRTLLEHLPCCTTNAKGTETGDPLNLVLVGARSDIVAALVRRQWHPAEVLWSGSLWRTFTSFLKGSRYRYSPISPLYVYGRPQDGGAQKARGSIHERNHARFWLSPIRFRGKEVWLGQISRDIGIKFTLKSPTISTHVIDPDVDEARRYLAEDLLYSQALHRVGYVKGVGETSKDAPQMNLVGDPWYSDGLRAVLFFEPRPYTLSDLEFLSWEQTPSARRALEKMRMANPAESDEPLFDDEFLRQRAVIKVDGGIRVSAAVPTVEESRSIFGVDLNENGIQPLWLEIKNGSDRLVYLLPTGLDPEYFAPLEVAFLYKGSVADYGALGEHLQALNFDTRSPIFPGAEVAGFVYTNLADPTMVAEVDLISQQWSTSIPLLVPVSGTETSQRRIDTVRELYTDADLIHIEDEAQLRIALETLPCCTTNEAGAMQGLPLNLVLIGEIEDVATAFVRRGYRYGPVTPLFAFRREQDVSAWKRSQWVAPQPHTLWMWATPLRYQGKPVWIGQISTVLGGRFADSDDEPWRTEPDMDEARNDVFQDMLYSQALAKLGFVRAMERVAASESRETPVGSSYHTDGLQAVMLFENKAVSLSEVDFFDWERLVDHYRQEGEDTRIDLRLPSATETVTHGGAGSLDVLVTPIHAITLPADCPDAGTGRRLEMQVLTHPAHVLGRVVIPGTESHRPDEQPTTQPRLPCGSKSCWDRQAGTSAYVATQFGHPSAGAESGYSRDPSATGAQETRDHRALQPIGNSQSPDKRPFCLNRLSVRGYRGSGPPVQ